MTVKTKQYKEKIEELKPWFHNIRLPDGTQTAPDHFLGDFPYFKWKQLSTYIPDDLSGWKILDVGCNAGFYSFELAKRGAFVDGIDLDPHYLKQAKWLAKELGLEDRTRFRQLQVYDLAREEGKYDMVWFMGVFYHLRYPMLAVDILSRKTKKLMVFQTLMIPGKEEVEPQADYHIHDREPLVEKGWPKLSFVESRFAGDPTNWFIINHAAVGAIYRTCGMVIVEEPLDETYILQPSDELSAVTETWNKSEYLSATCRPWKEEKEKFKKNNN